jgi:hypothetical protein
MGMAPETRSAILSTNQQSLHGCWRRAAAREETCTDNLNALLSRKGSEATGDWRPMGMNPQTFARPFSALRWRLVAATGLMVAFSSAAQASIILAPNPELADIERILADLERSEQDATINSSGASSASSHSKPQGQSPSQSENDPMLLVRNLSRSDGNMGSSSSSTTGGASVAPAALPGAAVSLARGPLTSRLATEAAAFLPDPPLEGSLRPPQPPASV